MPQPFPSNPDVENERRSLLSLGKLCRIASLKRMVERAAEDSRLKAKPDMVIAAER
jgi:hypothetical protein